MNSWKPPPGGRKHPGGVGFCYNSEDKERNMTQAQVLKRLDDLERELRELRSQVAGEGKNAWRSIAGSFADDPLFERAVKMGAEYRRSLRSESSGRRTKQR